MPNAEELELPPVGFVAFCVCCAAAQASISSLKGIYVNERAVVEHVDNAEKRLLRKLDLIILPQVTLLFLLNFIDRAAIGNAQVAGFSRDIGLSVPKNEYNIALMVFYIFYIIGEVPSSLSPRKVGSKWLTILCLAFCAVTIGSAWVHNFGTFLGVRMILGIFEGGVIPGITFLLTRFYTRSELAFRVGVFLSLGPGLSGAFGGLLAAGLLNADFPGLRTWQKFFVCEGIITALPETVRWLNPEERALALRRLEIEHMGQTDEKTTVHGVFKALCNPFTWLCTLAYGFINVTVQGTSLFLPTIVNGLGKYNRNTIEDGPSILCLCRLGRRRLVHMLKTRRHGLCIALSSILSVVGYIMFLASDNPKVLYGASFLTFTGALPCGPFFLAWATANAGSPTARAVAAATVSGWGSRGSCYVKSTSPIMCYPPGPSSSSWSSSNAGY